MIKDWIARRLLRLFLGTGAVLGGGIVMVVTHHSTAYLFFLTVSLATLVGIGKLASP